MAGCSGTCSCTCSNPARYTCQVNEQPCNSCRVHGQWPAAHPCTPWDCVRLQAAPAWATPGVQTDSPCKLPRHLLHAGLHAVLPRCCVAKAAPALSCRTPPIYVCYTSRYIIHALWVTLSQHGYTHREAASWKMACMRLASSSLRPDFVMPSCCRTSCSSAMRKHDTLICIGAWHSTAQHSMQGVAWRAGLREGTNTTSARQGPTQGCCVGTHGVASFLAAALVGGCLAGLSCSLCCQSHTAGHDSCGVMKST